ncbi:hypothetical protein NST99_00925 [Paenibacillus sp. FSL L8-0470]|uniref:hypothetical protein n=1 Tax=unclassified Paenibacillus TaxID=185978 RepID=UPI0030F4E966
MKLIFLTYLVAPYHILEASNKVVGIIDFGVSGTGDPAHDVGDGHSSVMKAKMFLGI